MKKLFIFSAFLVLYGATSLLGQNVVFNGDFELVGTDGWSMVGGNVSTCVIQNETVSGQNSYCLKRYPSNPNNQGGIEQQVHLVAGLEYDFYADIMTRLG